MCIRDSLTAAISNVLEPSQYIGNTILIIGFGDVKVKIQLPHIVNTTDTNSNQNAVLSDL